MRLLNTKTRKLEEFFGEAIPQYAILSHTWGENEVTFKDIERDGYQSGSVKIDGCLGRSERSPYVWIDTCCIDKSSSAELSEAINSMWSWYKKAGVCYVYLSDVPPRDVPAQKDSAFRKSRWFTRGWTLQELIAPDRVAFYDSSWELIGRNVRFTNDFTFDRRLQGILAEITGIPKEYLNGKEHITSASIAQRMSWAANRETKRVEDIAYSLLGIFGVNMAMLYGEGTQAFKRLQEEIMKSSYDETIFAWGLSTRVQLNGFSLLASSPADFDGCGDLVPVAPKGIKSSHYVLTNKGLLIEMIISGVMRGEVSIGRLNCSSLVAEDTKSIAVPLVCSMEDDSVFFRANGSPPVLVSSSLFRASTRAHVYLHRDSADPMALLSCGLSIDYWLSGTPARLMVTEFYPPAWRGILETGSVYFPSRHLDLAARNNQKIIFRCKNADGPLDFAVRLEYTYNRSSTRPLSQK
jgi:hypothetical protein